MPVGSALALWLAAFAAFSGASADAGAESCDSVAEEQINVNLLQQQVAIDASLAQEDASQKLQPRSLGKMVHESPKANTRQAAAPVRSFTVDLDQDPAIRWNSLLDYYHQTGLLEAMEDATQLMPHMPDVLNAEWFEAVKFQIPIEIMEEMNGVLAYAKKLRPEFKSTVQDLIVHTFYYEQNFPQYCSGVLAAMENGTVVHGRNLDYPLVFPWKGKMVGWSEITVDVTFMKSGKPLFESVTWPFQFGVHTAMRYDGWTIEQNTRDGVDMRGSLAAIGQGGLGSSLVMRTLMEEVPDFDTAVERLWNARWAAPQYFILSGAKPWQGGVLSVDQMGMHLPSSPPVMKLSSAGSWHLVQTNDDLNAAPTDERRPAAEAQLAKITPSAVTPMWMMSEMQSAPLFNGETTFTWVARADMGYHQIALPPSTINVMEFSELHPTAL